VNLIHVVHPLDDLRAPVLLGAFDGWIDAAGSASATADHIAQGSDTVATFDPDALFDYRSRRPVLDVVDGVLSRLDYPQLAIRRRQAGGRDLLVLYGAEPDFRWKQLADDLMEFALTHGVVEWVSVGAVPAAVPHTRPVPVFATASDAGLLRHGETQGPDGLLRVPAAALSVVEMGVGGAGIPTTGFYAQVPPYVGGPYAAGTIALVEHIARHLEVEIPLGSLMDEANAQRIGLDAAVQAQEETRDFVTRLEEQQPEDGIPSGDELASEIERYLRDAGDDPR
jgi:hypothetical protein